MVFAKKLTPSDLPFMLCVVAITILYAFYLFSFTLFEGFSTFSNDAGTYALLAQKWSPYFEPSEAITNTWPTQILPPGLAWVLAITGASKSLWLSHFLVSMCLLFSICLVGWVVCRLEWLVGGLVFISLVLLPGAIVASLGILSENLYLLISLISLLLYSRIVKSKNSTWVWYLLLFIGLTLTILTRTIGIALIAGVFTVMVFDKSQTLRQRINSALTIVTSIIAWLLWGYLNPQVSDHTYTSHLSQLFFADGTVGGVLGNIVHIITINFMQILSSWGRYFSLSLANVGMFFFSFALLASCFVGLGLRLRKLEVDAVYIVFYFLILLLWPYPDELPRFLHPVMFLLLLQPVLTIYDNPAIINNKFAKPTLVAVLAILIINSMIIQLQIYGRQKLAVDANPLVAHSYDYFDSQSVNTGVRKAMAFIDIMDAIKYSIRIIPPNSIVASNKHSNFAVLSNRQAVNLSTIVPYGQQLCNLKVRNVDVVFLSNLTTGFDSEGQTQIEKYQDISSNIMKLKDSDEKIVATIISINKENLETELAKSEFECLKFSDQI